MEKSPQATTVEEPNSTMAKRIFDDPWKIWIWTNVGRGCDKDGIFKVLLENGFNCEDIENELGYVLTVDPNDLPNPARTPTRFFPNAVRVESDKIEMFSIQGFLNESECEHLIDRIKNNLHPSTVVDDTSDDPEFRTSKTCVFSLENDPLTAEINIRICRLMGISPTYGEGIQGQYYDPGAEFKPHRDSFDAHSESLSYAGYQQNQRTWTFMIYLNETDEGGETVFENIDFSIKPRRGDALFWNNLYPDGQPNLDTLHHATKVTKGYKAVVTKWFRTFGSGPESIRQRAELIPNYNAIGIEKSTIPQELFTALKQHYQENRQSAVDEWEAQEYLKNHDIHPTTIIELTDNLKSQTQITLKPIMESWAGVDLTFSAVYGLRVYNRGTTLAHHRDTVDTHIISAILNIAQEVDEDWPLDIEDNYYRSHHITMAPGDMILYEGARLQHGRVTPLNGDMFCNLFVHFRPAT